MFGAFSIASRVRRLSVKESVDGEGVAGNSVAKDVLWKRVNGQGGHVVMS